MKTIHFLLVLAVFLTACAAPTPVPTASLPQPTATEATQALAPTATEIPATATALPTAIPATATPDARQQEQAALLPLVEPCNFSDQPIVYSPNNTWVIVNCLGETPDTGLTTKIARLDGSQQWSLSFNDTYLKPYRAGDANLSALLQQTFIHVRWTKNEDFLYLAIQTAATDEPFAGYDGLYRLDLFTGKLRSVLKPAAAPFSATYAFQFSPSGTKLAYLNASVQPLTMVILDTVTGTEDKIVLDARFSQGGSLLWSDNENQLLVSALDKGQNGGHALILFDLEAQTNTYLVQQSATAYLPVEWIYADTIYAESFPGNWVYIDLLTKEIRPAPERLQPQHGG